MIELDASRIALQILQESRARAGAGEMMAWRIPASELGRLELSG